MKIKRLELKAYGHFTDCALDFQSGTPGLHIIYGANEAGKSTCLRALQGLLFGIPMRTSDNFLHDYGKLLIGGHLENADGKELIVWRRKKNVGDLLGADLNVIDQGVLAEFLHGIEGSLFTALFGIDHETLVSGGKEILEQKGDIGQALFSAGAGLSALHGLIAEMDRECEGLFKPGGSRPELNQAIKAYQDIKKDIRALALSSAAWKEQKEIFETASGELERVEEQKRELSAELERLKRLVRAIPHLARRVALQEQLTSLREVAALPVDFPDRLHEALSSGRQAEQSLREAASREEGLLARKRASTLRQDILDQSETIGALHQKLGVQRQAEQDRPRILAQLIECRTEAATVLNQVASALDLTQIEKIRALHDRRQKILTLGNQFAGLDHALRQSKTRVAELQSDLDRIEAQLETLSVVGDLTGLRAAVSTAQRAGDIDGALRALERDSAVSRSTAKTDLQRLGLWEGALEDVLSLPLPSAATIERFVELDRESEENLRRNQRAQKDVQDELARTRRDIKEIETSGVVATEEDLTHARSRRDQGWQLVKRAWLGGETLEREISGYDESGDLPGAFERGMQTADEVSDHLRSAADRVHKYASLLADQEKLDRQQQRLAAEAAEINGRREHVENEWLAVWDKCNLRPLPPREMRGWLDQCQDIVRALREGHRKELDKQPLRDQRKQLRAALITEMKSLGKEQAFGMDELAPVLACAEELLAGLQAVQDLRQSLVHEKRRNAKEMSAAEEELRKARQAMNLWSEQWSAALDGFGLAGNARPDEAANALDLLRTCLDKSAAIAGYEQRIADIDRSAGEFQSSVDNLIHSVAPELQGVTAEQAVVKLQAMLTVAEKNKSVLEKLEEDLDATKEDLRRAKVAMQAAMNELASLRALAQCASDDDLAQVGCRFRGYRSAASELATLEETLLAIAEGIGLDALEEQRQAIDPNDLPGRIESLNRKLRDELEPLIRGLAEQKGAAGNELQKMDGSGEAAAREDAAQAALARVRRLADRYLRVRLGRQLLKNEIERYRQENQDPILKLASRYFSELTLGAFPGLRSDLDDHGGPILVGVCGDGRLKKVEEMSSGTRDQLYLALRLATLEWRLEKHEPMPFIADDILVNFDDIRSGATLKALAELAKRNQVILFTHHRQVVNAARAIEAAADIVVHDLAALPLP